MIEDEKYGKQPLWFTNFTTARTIGGSGCNFSCWPFDVPGVINKLESFQILVTFCADPNVPS